MRLFVALDPSPEAIDAAAEWWTEACLALPPDEWRALPTANWHITLAFYGDMGGDDADRLADELAACAETVGPFDLRFSAPGVFPRLQRARAFWIGVEDDSGGRMRALARCCRRSGFGTGRKRTGKLDPFRGHLTLARRIGSPDPVDPVALAEMPSVPEVAWRAEELRLYRSELRPEGARYFLLEAFPLGNGGR